MSGFRRCRADPPGTRKLQKYIDYLHVVYVGLIQSAETRFQHMNGLANNFLPNGHHVCVE